ncbi:hypothetical protein C0J52_17087 [Blattella germanica]|nr:hypothetical protein C0J52_17087 [Blattella germanica]
MGRPFVTTAVCCVFCFLCAAHVQCLSHHSKHHVSIYSDGDIVNPSEDVDSIRAWEELVKKQRRKRSDALDAASVHKNCRHRRDVSEEQIFVKRLFTQFGEGDKMTFEGFERMLRMVGLERLVSPVGSSQVVDNVSPPSISNVASNKHDVNGSQIQPNAIVSPNEAMTSRETKNHSEKQCLNGRELFTAFSDDHEDKLLPESLQRLCPGLLYQLTDINTDCIVVSAEPSEHHDPDVHSEVVNHSQSKEDDHHHRNPQYEQKHGHPHNASVLDSTQVTTAPGSLDETQPDGLDEMRPITTACNSVATAPDSEHGTELNPSEAESYTVIIREHENNHHGHSHTHGHVHSPPDSLSSVAWMVVMGDGLHNFTDGMAIGAAFAANIAGGFSTAVAVFCHELPHELGDFAVLLKAGMSAKQAVFYNLLSSILSMFGMVLGVFVGESEVATAWVFSAAAGMFLYIALVDMCMGLLTGIGIMLLIAMYEHDLKTVFTDD